MITVADKFQVTFGDRVAGAVGDLSIYAYYCAGGLIGFPTPLAIYLDTNIEGTIGKLSLAFIARYTYKWRFSNLLREARGSYSDPSRYNRLRFREPCPSACACSTR